MKVLFIRLSSIGDIVLCSPVLRCTKLQIDAEIHFLTKPQFSSIPKANPHIDKVHIWEKDNLREVIRELKAEKFDWIADLHHNLRSFGLKQKLRRPGRSFPKLNLEKWLLVNMRINRLTELHIVDRYLKTVEPLGVKKDGEGLDYHIPVDEEIDLTKYGLEAGQFIAIAVGAAHRTKCMEDGQVSRLAGMLPLPVVLLGGNAEKERGESIRANAASEIHNLCGDLSIHGSASVVRQAGLVISPDTAMMHIAAAYRVPLISFWGNTIPEFGMYPYYGLEPGPHEAFEIKGLPCRPCSKIGYERCPQGHFRCIRDLDLRGIAIQAEAMLRMV